MIDPRKEAWRVVERAAQYEGIQAEVFVRARFNIAASNKVKPQQEICERHEFGVVKVQEQGDKPDIPRIVPMRSFDSAEEAYEYSLIIAEIDTSESNSRNRTFYLPISIKNGSLVQSEYEIS